MPRIFSRSLPPPPVSEVGNGAPDLHPQLHIDFIRNQALLTDTSGADAVEAFHRSLFLYQHATEFERWEQETKLHEARLVVLEVRMNEVESQLTGISHLLPNPIGNPPASAAGEAQIRPPSTPWNGWDMTMFLLSGFGVIGLLIFGVLNISFNLLESGLVTFQETPIRAYFWAALLPAGALAVKVGWDCLRSPRLRGLYLWICLGLGLLGVLAWLSAYAAVYPSLSKNTAERIQSLSVFNNAPPDTGWFLGSNAAGTRRTDIILVGSQALAEIFLSAVMGIYMTQLFLRHHAARSSANPRFQQLTEERRRLDAESTRERLGLAEARGQRSRLDHQLSALLAFARSTWQREVALRNDQSHQQRLLLDQIAAQLHDRLGGSGTLERNPNHRDRPLPALPNSDTRSAS